MFPRDRGRLTPVGEGLKFQIDLAKASHVETAFRVCTLGMEIWGGMGYMKEARMEKLLRDAASFLHSDGTNQVHRLKAAQLFGGLAAKYGASH